MARWVQAAKLSHCPPGSSLEVVVDGRIVAILNVGGEVFALDGICPHQGGPLGKGCLVGNVLTCPWHGWQFDVRTGRHQLSQNVVQPRYDVRVEADSVLIDVERGD